MKIYTCVYYTPSGKKETRTSPFVADAEAAFRWLLAMKPYIMSDLMNVTVKPRSKGDPR